MPDHAVAENPWVRRLVAAPEAGLRLICFPHAGGSAGYFRPLAMALAPHVDLLAVQYPGRQDRRGERAMESVTDMADAFFEALPDCLDRPFAFFGHSLGATVAYEVALRCEELPERRPLRLFASAKSAPCVPRRHHIDRLDDESLIREIDKLGGISPGTLNDPGFRGLFLPTVRADYRAVETYSPAPGTRVSCPITVFIGGSDPLVPVADATAWDLHTSKGTDTKVFEGGHFYLDENVPEVAAAVLGALTMSSGEEGGRPAAGEPPNHALTYGL